MATSNNDKISSAENGLTRAKRLIQEVIESDHTLHTRTRQRCYDMARDAYELHELLTQLVNIRAVSEEDEHDYSSLSSDYSAKTIMGTYAHALKDCTTVNFGIVQVGMFVSLLAEWYDVRFNPRTKNPKFTYRADRVSEWIDLMILAYGAYMHRDNITEFDIQLHEFLEDIQLDFNQTWPLPYFVSSMEDSVYLQDFTEEAILIERIVKPHIYSNRFYFNLVHSVEDRVCKHRPELKSLSMNDLVLLPTVTTTSSFDLKKYTQGEKWH